MDSFKSFARYSGILAIVIEYMAIGYFIFSTGTILRADQPISYFSMVPMTKLVFAGAFILAAIFVGLFGYWLYNSYSLNRRFAAAYGAIVISQILFASFIDGGRLQMIHLLAALTTGLMMPVAVYLFIKQAKPQRFKKAMQVCLYLQIIAFVSLVLTSGRFILINEIILGGTFHLWAVLATFDRQGVQK